MLSFSEVFMENPLCLRQQSSKALLFDRYTTRTSCIGLFDSWYTDSRFNRLPKPLFFYHPSFSQKVLLLGFGLTPISNLCKTICSLPRRFCLEPRRSLHSHIWRLLFCGLLIFSCSELSTLWMRSSQFLELLKCLPCEYLCVHKHLDPCWASWRIQFFTNFDIYCFSD